MNFPVGYEYNLLVYEDVENIAGVPKLHTCVKSNQKNTQFQSYSEATRARAISPMTYPQECDGVNLKLGFPQLKLSICHSNILYNHIH